MATATPRRPSARTWAMAAAELIAAFVVARLIVVGDQPAEVADAHHHMPGMDTGSMVSPPAADPGWLESGAAVLAAVGVLWWLVRRAAAPALLAAVALIVLASSPAVRIWVTQSHLVAMVALELLMVIAPLLALAAVPVRTPDSDAPVAGAPRWTVAASVAGLAYAAFLVVVHLPAVHRHAATEGTAPLWLVPAAAAIGIGYWAVVLRGASVLPVAVRRAVLLGGQEVAAFIGLLSLFGAWGSMGHQNPLGLSAGWDQRLGGLFMMAACAAVAIPVYRRLSP